VSTRKCLCNVELVDIHTQHTRTHTHTHTHFTTRGRAKAWESLIIPWNASDARLILQHTYTHTHFTTHRRAKAWESLIIPWNASDAQLILQHTYTHTHFTTHRRAKAWESLIIPWNASDAQLKDSIPLFVKQLKVRFAETVSGGGCLNSQLNNAMPLHVKPPHCQYCNALQHTATHCNALQIHCNIWGGGSEF